MFNQVKVQEIKSFNELENEILVIIGELINSRLVPTKNFIEEFFEIESGFINTKHPDFLDSATNSIINSSHKENENESELLKKIPKRERNEIELIKQMLFNYFEVVKKNICDYIPKIILTLLVTKTVQNCEKELIATLYKNENIEKYLKENEDSVKMKKLLKTEISELKKCLQNLTSL